MASSTRTAVLAVVALLPAAARSAQDSPALMRVGTERSLLKALPRAAGNPTLAELLPGTAVRVAERRDGFARVTIEGWLPESALAALPVEAAPAEEPAEPAPPAPPPAPPTPVHDLAFAHHVGVAATLRGGADARELALDLELRTTLARPVIVAGSRIEGRVRVYEQRRIAGGRVRGAEILTREVTFEAGRASLVVPLKDLGESPPRTVLISASADLTPQRRIVGAATDVELAAR